MPCRRLRVTMRCLCLESNTTIPSSPRLLLLLLRSRTAAAEVVHTYSYNTFVITPYTLIWYVCMYVCMCVYVGRFEKIWPLISHPAWMQHQIIADFLRFAWKFQHDALLCNPSLNPFLSLNPNPNPSSKHHHRIAAVVLPPLMPEFNRTAISAYCTETYSASTPSAMKVRSTHMYILYCAQQLEHQHAVMCVWMFMSYHVISKPTHHWLLCDK